VATISSFSRLPESQRQYAEPGAGADSLTDAAGNPDFAAILQDPQFRRYRSRLLRFTVPLTAVFLCWYLTYVLLAAYAHDFMSTKVFGSVNVALLLGLAQFVTTPVIMLSYVRYTRGRLDPELAALRDRAGADRS
jgi:uncharacterized membrane protein (DUF485 family)